LQTGKIWQLQKNISGVARKYTAFLGFIGKYKNRAVLTLFIAES